MKIISFPVSNLIRCKKRSKIKQGLGVVAAALVGQCLLSSCAADPKWCTNGKLVDRDGEQLCCTVGMPDSICTSEKGFIPRGIGPVEWHEFRRNISAITAGVIEKGMMDKRVENPKTWCDFIQFKADRAQSKADRELGNAAKHDCEAAVAAINRAVGG